MAKSKEGMVKMKTEEDGSGSRMRLRAGISDPTRRLAKAGWTGI